MRPLSPRRLRAGTLSSGQGAGAQTSASPAVSPSIKPFAGSSESPVCDCWLFGSQEALPESAKTRGRLKEMKPRQAVQTPVRRPQGSVPPHLPLRGIPERSHLRCWAPGFAKAAARPPPGPGKPRCLMQRGRALVNRPSPAGRSCFLSPSERFVSGHKF